jgi:hypothetical protein
LSKTLGVVLTVAAVAFAIAVPFFAPLGIAIAASTVAAISAGLAAAIMVNGLLMPKGIGDGLIARQANQVTLQLGEVPRVAMFGDAASGE